MVNPWANTINCNLRSLNTIATKEPEIIKSIIKSLAGHPESFLPKERVSDKITPPSVAFPINDENDAAKSPIMKTIYEAEPKRGSSALPISAADFTEIPLVYKTAPAAINTNEDTNPKITIPDMLSFTHEL